MNFEEQLAHLDKLERYIQERARTLSIPQDTYQSDTIDKLVSSLAKAQGSYPKITFNRKDSYFQEEYVDFDTIMTAVRPILSANELAVIQQQRLHDGGALVLHTILTHSSGQWMESRARIVPMSQGPRPFGSELNFQKSQALIALIGVTVTNDPYDDNACAAMEGVRKTNEKGTKINYATETNSRDVITKEQLEELEYELAEWPDIAKMVLEQWKLHSLADMPKERYLKAVTKIREIKLLRQGIKS